MSIVICTNCLELLRIRHTIWLSGLYHLTRWFHYCLLLQQQSLYVQTLLVQKCLSLTILSGKSSKRCHPNLETLYPVFHHTLNCNRSYRKIHRQCCLLHTFHGPSDAVAYSKVLSKCHLRCYNFRLLFQHQDKTTLSRLYIRQGVYSLNKLHALFYHIAS